MRRRYDEGGRTLTAPMRVVDSRLALVAGALVAVALAGCGAAPATGGQAGTEASTPGAAAAKSERGEAADAAATAVEEPLPPEAVQQFDQAVVHMSAGDHAAAEQALRTLADTYPAYSGALLNLGILYAKTGRLEEAQQTLRGAIERKPDNAIAFNQLGIVYRKLGRFQEADEAYQRAVQIDPNYALAYLNLGVLCDLYLQQPQRALEAYERYLALSPAPDARVSGWVNELKARLGAQPRAARVDS